MRRFADREIDVLVATTVIEVGIDIPNATVMVVLGAERFGLAQLHQLRGRIGPRFRALVLRPRERGIDSERLAAMVEEKDGRRPIDGFELAKRDLAIRGAGRIPWRAPAWCRLDSASSISPTWIRSSSARQRKRPIASSPAIPSLRRSEHAELLRAVDQLWRRYALA